MKRLLLQAALAATTLVAGTVQAEPLRALDDSELSQVAARDGISFAAHVSINDPSLIGAVTTAVCRWAGKATARSATW